MWHLKQSYYRTPQMCQHRVRQWWVETLEVLSWGFFKQLCWDVIHIPHNSLIYSVQFMASVYSQNFSSISTISFRTFHLSPKETVHSLTIIPPFFPSPLALSCHFLRIFKYGAVLSALFLDLVKPHILFLWCIQTVCRSQECCDFNARMFGSGTQFLFILLQTDLLVQQG